jgi:hypothetical protein
MRFHVRESAHPASLTRFAHPDNESAVRRFRNEGCTTQRAALHAMPHAALLRLVRAGCQAFARAWQQWAAQ